MGYRLRAILVLGIVAALSGCTTTSQQTEQTVAASPTPAPTSSAAPTPAPTQEQSPEPSRLVISSTDLQIVLTDGTVAETISYFDPMVPAVERITELFGAPPTVDPSYGIDAASYAWPGFQMGSDGPAIPPTRAAIYVTASAAEINGIQLLTTDGNQVGDDLRPLSEAHPEDSGVYPTQNGDELSVKVMSVPVEPGDTERSFHTGLSADPADGVIRQIHAPEKNFE